MLNFRQYGSRYLYRKAETKRGNVNKYATDVLQVKRKTQETFRKVPWQI
jgi:hypothetical protein